MSTLLSWLSPRFFYFFEHLEGSYIKVFVLYICRLAFLRGCFCWCSPLWTDGPCFACLVISLLLKTGYCNLIMQELWKSDFLPSPGFAGFFVCFFILILLLQAVCVLGISLRCKLKFSSSLVWAWAFSWACFVTFYIPPYGCCFWMSSSLNGCSVVESYMNLCDPMDCSMSGSPVLHYLLELAQIHVHWVGDAIWSSHPLSLNVGSQKGKEEK